MATPFIGAITMFGGNFAPRSYAFCNGQILSIAQNTALFSILGVTYGGDGRVTFALPNLQGRFPMHWGSGPGLTPRVLGEQSGAETVTLLSTQMPAHNHTPVGLAANGSQSNPTNATWGTTGTPRVPNSLYSSAAPNVQMNANAVGLTGGNQAHENMSPFLAITFIIATQGIFPARN
jgi:microcystin-dependent protein